MWRIYRLIDFIKDIPKEIKWFFQRGFRGYSDRDVWAIDVWFENTLIPMLEQLQKTKHGYPMDMTEQQWNITLNAMIDYFKESTDEYCSEKNEYEEEYLNSMYEDNQEDFKKLRDKWLDREKKIEDYKTHMKDEAFKLFSKYFYNLWD